MTPLTLCDTLVDRARQYRPDSIASIRRNAHMHSASESLTQADIDAVLTDFINFIAGQNGIDYALYAKDLDQDFKR